MPKTFEIIYSFKIIQTLNDKATDHQQSAAGSREQATKAISKVVKLAGESFKTNIMGNSWLPSRIIVNS